MGRRTRTAGLVVLGTLLVAGCSGSSDGSVTLERGGTANGSAGGAADGAAAATRPSAVPAPAGSRAAQGTTQGLVTGSAKIRTAQLSVTVADRAAVARRADQAATLAERVGGEVESEDRGRTYASLRLRVPPAELTASLRTLSTYGTTTAQEVSARDVTGQVADVTSRVRSAEQAIARLRALYASATRVTDVIAVEQQLSTREADLESLQAQQRTLAGQTSLATITVDFRAGATAPATKSDDRSGFLGGVSRGWDAFTGVLSGAAVGLGAALPFLVVLALVALAGRLLWRRRRAALSPAGGPPTTP